MLINQEYKIITMYYSGKYYSHNGKFIKSLLNRQKLELQLSRVSPPLLGLIF